MSSRRSSRTRCARLLACACALLLSSACSKQEVSLGSDRSTLNAGDGASAEPHAGDGGGGGLGGMSAMPMSGTSGSESPPFDSGHVLPDASDPDATLGMPCGPDRAECASGELCEYPRDLGCDEERQEGTCAVIPDTCRSEPVCGCDGVTYPNACAAASFQVVIDHEGSCEPTTDACEGASGATCAQDEFCDRAWSCAGEGVCRHVPSMCRSDARPVCGCDNVTYDSICEAAANSVSAAYPGSCGGGSRPPSGTPCGGPEGTACPSGQFCDVTQSDGCDVPDADGICLYIPSFCYFFYAPVCGCDGVTYENPCFAATASMSLRQPGSCP